MKHGEDPDESEEKPDSKETHLEQLARKLRNGSIGNMRRRYVLGVSLAMLLLSLLLGGLLLSGSSETLAVNVLAPVKPGTAIKQCKPIDIRNIEKLSLDFLDDLIESTKENQLNMVTAQHFGVNYCVVVVCEKDKDCFVMLNPSVTGTHSPATITHEDTLLCSNPTAVQMKRYKNVDVEWFDRKGERVMRHFEKPQSYKLQHMLDVLYGTDVCG